MNMQVERLTLNGKVLVSIPTDGTMLCKTHLLPTVLIKPRKPWLHPTMTEKLLTGTLSLNTSKQTKIRLKKIDTADKNESIVVILTIELPHEKTNNLHM